VFPVLGAERAKKLALHLDLHQELKGMPGLLLLRPIVPGENKMPDNSVCKQAKGAGSHPVAPKNEKQAPEQRRRWIENALEDDEVHEALSLRHAQKKAKSDE
jgi:hypothetical protein